MAQTLAGTAESNAASVHRTLDDLDQAILRLTRRMNAHCHALLVLVREFDERCGWMSWGSSSCAHWLAWRCDLSLSAAREQVRVAHALKTLPGISAAFATGVLSYSKVRALTRIATPHEEAELIRMATCMTAAHLDQHCQQRRNGCVESRIDAANAHSQRSLRSFCDERRGLVTITIELPIAEGKLFERAIDKASADQGGSQMAPDDSTSWRALQADAAVAMAKTYLSGSVDGSRVSVTPGDAAQAGASASSTTADLYQVMVHVDHDALAGRRGQSEMPIDTVKRLCCDGSLVPIVENEQGELLNVGRKQRVVTTAIRRALWARDRGCTFPGCSHTRFVDAHHIEHWSTGGETRLDNLTLLCDVHHRLVHEGGYAIERDHRGKRSFRRPDGRAVPDCGYQVKDWRDDYSNNDPVDAACSTETSAEEFPYTEGFHLREPAVAYRLNNDPSPECRWSQPR